MILEYVNFIMWPQQVGVFIYYSYIHVEIGKLGGIMLSRLYAGIIVHPNNIHMKHCAFQYYSPNLLLTSTLSLKIMSLFTIFLLFIIRIGVNLFLFYELFPHEGKTV